MVHGKCIKQQNFQSIAARVPRFYACGSCLFNELPFKNPNLQKLDKSINLEDSTECQHKVIIENNSKKLSRAHLNTQSKHWLKNNKHMLEYAQIEGYNSKFVGRDGRKGGGFGDYVKDCFKYKIRKDIVNLEPDTEHT